MTFKNKTRWYTFIHIHQHTQLTHNEGIHKLHTAGTALSMPFNLCYVHMLVLRMVADGMHVINNIKCGIYSFYVHQNIQLVSYVTAPNTVII